MKPQLTKGHDGICDVKGCRNPMSLIYYSHEICTACWTKHCSDTIDLKAVLNIKQSPVPVESAVQETPREIQRNLHVRCPHCRKQSDHVTSMRGFGFFIELKCPHCKQKFKTTVRKELIR